MSRARTIATGRALLVAFAAANLALGLALVVTQPARADDVWIVYDWCRAWLLHGAQLYAGVGTKTDYPPNAIVLFSPLALMPQSWVVPLWTTLTLVLTPVYAWLVIRSTSPRMRGAAAAVPILLFLCWGGVRTFLEFSRLSMTLAFAALLMADSRPSASGVALGLALVKPHIAGPIALWVLVTKRTRVAAVAAIVVATGWAVYCMRAHVGPHTVIVGYVGILRSLFAGRDAWLGLTSLQPWWLALTGDSLGAILWGVGSGVLLLVPCVMAMGRDDRPIDRRAAAIALFCLCSLLTLYHIGSNVVVLMLPAFAFLLLLDDPATARRRLVAVALIQGAMMLDIPVHFPGLVPDHGLAFLLVRDADRLIVLLTFGAVVAFGGRPRIRAESGEGVARRAPRAPESLAQAGSVTR